MGKAKQLTSEEIGKLKILKELGVSNTSFIIKNIPLLIFVK